MFLECAICWGNTDITGKRLNEGGLIIIKFNLIISFGQVWRARLGHSMPMSILGCQDTFFVDLGICVPLSVHVHESDGLGCDLGVASESFCPAIPKTHGIHFTMTHASAMFHEFSRMLKLSQYQFFSNKKKKNSLHFNIVVTQLAWALTIIMILFVQHLLKRTVTKCFTYRVKWASPRALNKHKYTHQCKLISGYIIWSDWWSCPAWKYRRRVLKNRGLKEIIAKKLTTNIPPERATTWKLLLVQLLISLP